MRKRVWLAMYASYKILGLWNTDLGERIEKYDYGAARHDISRAVNHGVPAVLPLRAEYGYGGNTT